MTTQTILLAMLATSALAQTASLGLFTTAADIGSPAKTGATQFDPGSNQYRITGSGANIWAKQDQFQYAWREITGNFTVTATMHFLGKGNDHRKAGIMIRQSADSDAAYVDAIMHGNGMPAIQWRSRKGEDTNAFDFPVLDPGTYKIKLVRTGPKMHMYLAKEGAEPVRLANTEVTFTGPVLIGLAVCAHDANTFETVIFTDVSIEPQATPSK